MWIVTKKRGKKKRAKELEKFREYSAVADRITVGPGPLEGDIVFYFRGTELPDGMPVDVRLTLSTAQAIRVAGQLTEEVWADSMRDDDTNDEPTPFREAT
jgi:hypothetical protein